MSKHQAHMKRKLLLIFLLSFIIFHSIYSQSNSVGIGTTTPNNSAILDLQSTSKGFLMPRLSTAQRKAIASPAQGLLVFDTDKSCLYIFDGTAWQSISIAGGYSIPFIEREATDGADADHFGFSVSISGNYAVIGAPNDNNLQGSAYIFFKQGGNWIQQAKLTASDGMPSDKFGFSVAISGDFAVVGAPFDDQFVLLGNSEDRGSIYVFKRTGTVWTQLVKLVADDGATDNSLGYSVSISGNYIVTGALNGDNGVTLNQGAAYIFFYNGTSWSQQSKLIASNGAQFDQFGRSVCINGNYVIVGAPFHDNKGAAYIYFRFGTTWIFDQALPAGHGIPNDGEYGSSVALYDTIAIVGASSYDRTDAPSSGISYMYERNGSVWNAVISLTPTNLASGDLFGSSAAIFGNYAIVGAEGANVGSFENQGSAFLYKLDVSEPFLDRKIEIPGNGQIKRFGESVAIDGFNIIIGAPHNLGKGKVFFLNIE